MLGTAMKPGLLCDCPKKRRRLSTNIIYKMAALYSSAAQIVDQVMKKQGTAKSLVINNRFPKKKKLYALVCETLKCKCVTIL